MNIPRFLLVLTFSQIPCFGSGFGIDSGEDFHTINSGAGLIIDVRKSSGGIESIHLDGRRLTVPGRRISAINSDVGSKGTTVKTKTRGGVAMVALTTDKSNGVVAGLTHYYIVRKGENTLYMATYAENEPGNGEMRWITRLDSGLFPDAPVHSDIRECMGNIESRDVFGMADGTTRSKYYGNQRAMDLAIRGVSGDGVGVFMDYGNRESSSGGPFFRDIQNQTGSAAEVYNYMNSGHNQTEDLRLGVLYGPYALCFTDGSVPTAPDMRFISGLGLKGHVGENQRGGVAVKRFDGMAAGFPYTLAFANDTAQYWTAVDPSGTARRTGMKPGKYRMILYKGELAVHEEEVTVSAARIAVIEQRRITNDPSAVNPVWRVGDWDGTPLEFRNGPEIPLMHPSDKRMTPWDPGTFLIGAGNPADFPACQWREVNPAIEMNFWMDDGRFQDQTIRIGITAAFAGGRPNIRVNGWSSKIPPPSSQPSSRSMTIGTYRGNNRMYAFDVPASAFVVGANTLRISPISGQNGGGFLSPGYAIDCVDMIRQERLIE